MHFLLLLPFLLVPALFFAQTSPAPLGVSNRATDPQAPANVNASDGVYEEFVLIRWEAAGGKYRLFRARSSAGASMQELTKSWQTSTWFCDYSAQKGVDYFYAVMGSDGKTSSALSRLDKGFLKKDSKTAYDESLTATTPDKYTTGRQTFLLVSEVQPDTSIYEKRDTVRLDFGLLNTFDEPSPRTDVRVYLSADDTWDFGDRLLVSKSYSGFPANLKVTLTETVQLPGEILPGEYHLIVVTAPEGNILRAKTGSAKINISGQ